MFTIRQLWTTFRIVCGVMTGTADTFTDSLVVSRWYYIGEPVFWIGTIVLILSQMLSSFLYWVNAVEPTTFQVVAHGLGCGLICDGFSLLKSFDWTRDMIGQDNDLFRTRVCESFCEATIFVILQCFVTIKEKTYTKLELFSILLSCYCTGIPFVEFIDRRLREKKITNMTVIERVILVVLWAADVFIRILPILYMLVSDSVGAW